MHNRCFLQKDGTVVLMKSSLLDHACSLVYVQFSCIMNNAVQVLQLQPKVYDYI